MSGDYTQKTSKALAGMYPPEHVGCDLDIYS